MSHDLEHANNQSAPAGESARHEWTPPTVSELPKLTDLTLQTLGPPVGGGGGTGGGGSGVFP